MASVVQMRALDGRRYDKLVCGGMNRKVCDWMVRDVLW